MSLLYDDRIGVMGERTLPMRPLHFKNWLLIFFLTSQIFLSHVFALSEIPQALDLRSGNKVDFLLKSGSAKKKYTVLIFLSIQCPCSRSHQPVLRKLYEDFSGDQFQFFGIHSNANESVQDSLKYFKDADLPFPVIQDSEGVIANELSAYKTPHAYILDPEMKVIYQGGVDNSSDASRATEHFIRDSLSLIQKGQSLKESKRRVLGCQILRSSS